MIRKLKLILAALLLPAVAHAAPNIVVILADDLGYGDVSYNGCPDFTTPNIDALAGSGAKCGNGYVTQSFCSPSRAGLLTGRYPQRFGYENQPALDSTNTRMGMPLTEILMPQVMKTAGYVTGMVGKWHLGLNQKFYNPTTRGFDEFFGFLGPSSAYYNPPALYRGTVKVKETAYLTDAFTREAVDFINRHAAQPFFLYLAYNAPHIPYQVPPQQYVNRVSTITNSRRRTYAAMVTALDDGVGAVMQSLQTNGIDGNTVVFFLSDNGSPINVDNLPLKGVKYDMLEGGIHVPFAVRWPTQIPPQSYAPPVSSLDIMMTAAAAAGAQLPSDRAYDGLNLMQYLTGAQSQPDRSLFFRWTGLSVATGPPGALDSIWAVRTAAGMKLVRPRSAGTRLYNVAADIGETTNLASSQPGTVSALKALYDQWDKLLVAPLWQFRGDYPPNSLELAGDWNGFNRKDAAWTMKNLSAPAANNSPDAFNWFTLTVNPTQAAAGSHQCFLSSDSSLKWAGPTFAIDGYTDLPRTTSSVNSAVMFDGLSYYSFRAISYRQSQAQPMRVGIFRTSAAPVSVTSAIANGNAIAVTLSAPKSAEERVYVRYSSDTYVTNGIVQASGNGTAYSATIPQQPSGAKLEYVGLTSTADLNGQTGAGVIDALTLACSASGKFIEP